MSLSPRFCGRCGALVLPGQTFCGRCGNPMGPAPPAVGYAYTYPVVSALSVPGAHHKLNPLRLLLIAGALMAVIVVGLTAVLVAARPTTTGCHFSCGPPVGTRALSSTAYTSSQFGYRVEYQSDGLQLGTQSSTGVELDASDGDGFVRFAGTPGGNVSAAMQSAVISLDTSTFQNLQQIGSIPGAEVGFVQGEGTAYSGQFVQSNGGQAVPITVMVIAASQNNLTITAIAVASQDTSTPDTNPFEMDEASSEPFDYALEDTVWPKS